MAGVAGLPETSNINGCDAREASKHPSNAPKNLGHCRTFPHRYRLLTPDGQRSPPFTPKPRELGKPLASAFPGQNEFELMEA